MNTRHFQFWPKRLSKTLTVPETSLYDNLVVSAKRYPTKPVLYYYGATYTYSDLLSQVDALAGYLEKELNVARGDRVALFMQNSPQYVIAFYAINRVRAVVVPINPMNTAKEVPFYINDCDSKLAIIGQELYPSIASSLNESPLENLIIAAYSDYVPAEFQTDDLPEEVKAPRHPFTDKNHYLMQDLIEQKMTPSEHKGEGNDIAVIPYTSGTTGLAKGCIHTNKTVQANVIGASHWGNGTSDSVNLTTLPLFHVTGMVHSMHTPIYGGAAMVMLTRWNRKKALECIEKYQVSHWVNISTMVIDLLAEPTLNDYEISSLASISGGGAPLPAAIGEKLYQLTGIRYAEGYGLSETIAQTHFNPADRPKLQCAGIPSFDMDARIINPDTLEELGIDEPGEIIVCGPQVFKGYHKRPEETAKAFIEIEGKKFFRTGDIGRVDEEGYFFIVDRVKRMINASGFKVWPTEVESLLYLHPAVHQACVVGAPDAKRGETVKAFVVLHEKSKGEVTEEELIEWSKTQMAAYKYPRVVEFTDSLPMTSTGKILWRVLQEQEWEKNEAVDNNESIY
ncbi:MAG TPA: long-chain fatty acid--CoA ligase [Candidatus Angelobacter sp.]|nr:long-chain fatty acid--CoA ligase [Candidatus Angelobacter sp.]